MTRKTIPAMKGRKCNMGLEIRRVPANWQHPKEEKLNYHTGQYESSFLPLYNEPYLTALNEWLSDHRAWEAHTHPDWTAERPRFWAQWDSNPPNVKYYRPDWPAEEMTWWQVYETVSEGTPVTPPFATQEELIEYLVANGEFWDQRRRADGDKGGMTCASWSRRAAEQFVKEDQCAPTGIFTPQHGFQTGVEALGNP